MKESIKKKIEIGSKITVELSIEFSEDETPDINDMSTDQLQAYLVELEGQLDDLIENEPEDEESDAYEDWSEKYEELEDLIDEVEDRLSETGE